LYPILFKDLIDIAGVRRTDGSLLNLSHVPKGSIDYVLAAEVAGLSILGLTMATRATPNRDRRTEFAIHLGKVHSANEVFANGERLGGIGGMPPAQSANYDKMMTFRIPSRLIGEDGPLAEKLRGTIADSEFIYIRTFVAAFQ
jgi:hypothetical protein|tara:strand:+ start:615 stop:1043 length:429 start_codon:yes stop_codon:yes gene_type:complete